MWIHVPFYWPFRATSHNFFSNSFKNVRRMSRTSWFRWLCVILLKLNCYPKKSKQMDSCMLIRLAASLIFNPLLNIISVLVPIPRFWRSQGEILALFIYVFICGRLVSPFRVPVKAHFLYLILGIIAWWKSFGRSCCQVTWLTFVFLFLSVLKLDPLLEIVMHTT